MEEVVSFPSRVDQAAASPPEAVSDGTARLVAAISLWARILNARLLALLALIFGAAIFGYAVTDPTPWRFVCAAGFAVGCVLPAFALFLKRG